MAVRAHDIALRDLFEQRRNANTARHLTQHLMLLGWIAMVELHHHDRERPTAVRARKLANPIEELILRCAMATEPFASSLRGPIAMRSRRKTKAVLEETMFIRGSRAYRVAVRAHDVALRDLGEELPARTKQRVRTRQTERLCLRIAMIEIHDVGREDAAAIHTRDLSELAQPRERRLLTSNDARDLRVAIARVVGEVVRTAVPFPEDAQA